MSSFLSLVTSNALLEGCSTDSTTPPLSVWSILKLAFSTPDTALSSTWQWCLAVVGLTFVVSTMTKNYSQVDKLWSIVPWVYAWRFVVDLRTGLMAVLATLWGLRVTYNFSRRGGYQWPPWRGDEDYRWSYLQSGGYGKLFAQAWFWPIFNLVFVSFYQNLLLWLLTAPASMIAHVVATQPDCLGGITTSSGGDTSAATEWNTYDLCAALVMAIMIVLEAFADNQQYAFQTEKYRRRNAKAASANNNTHDDDDEYYARGFCTSGLYAILRKPNYFAEQSIWVSYYLFSVAALYQQQRVMNRSVLLNPAIVGPILLILLFQGSGHLTEKITSAKYPQYRQYQQQVPLYIPNPIQVLRVVMGSGEVSISKQD